MRFWSAVISSGALRGRSLVVQALVLATLAAVACSPGDTRAETPAPSPTATATRGTGGSEGDASTPDSPPRDTESLTALPSIADLVEEVEPAVAIITVKTVQRGFFGPVESVGSGSGVIFREDGYILTNNHVVQDAAEVKVTLSDGRELEAEVVGTDKPTDLAVIKVDAAGLATLPFASASGVRVGDWVVAIGNAAGLFGKPSVTLGVVSALGRSADIGGVRLNDLVQTDAIINPGNSGGPLLNLEGEVVGINTAVLRGQRLEGIGFAMSTGTASLVADQLAENGRVLWPWLGVGVDNLDLNTIAELDLPVRQGVRIAGVEPEGPADDAGIQENDVITAIDGNTTPDVATLQTLMRTRFDIGQTVTVVVVRNGDELERDVTLEEFPR